MIKSLGSSVRGCDITTVVSQLRSWRNVTCRDIMKIGVLTLVREVLV